MKAKFSRNGGFENKKPQTGRNEAPKITDIVQMYDWPSKGASGQVRVAGPIEGRGVHKVKVKKKDGNEVEITKTCLAFDVETDEIDSTKKCPYCKLPKELQRFSKAYFMNVIDRRIEEDGPPKSHRLSAEEEKTGIKQMDSKSWTPYRVLRLPSGGALRMQSLGAKNMVLNKKTKEKKAFPVNHPKYGFDLDVSFDKNKPPAQMYEIDRNTAEAHTPITEDQDEYLLWNVELVYPAEEFSEAKKEAEKLLERFGGPKDDDDGDDDDDDDDAPKSKKKVTGKSKSRDEDDEDEEDEDDEDMDLDDDDDDDEDEDEKPKSKSKSKPAPAKKKRADPDDEDDEDEESEDEEDEDEEEDDEDEPPKSKSKSKVKTPPAKKKRPDPDDEDEDEEEDDDEDDEDDEDEEDEDEEEAPKSKSKAKSKPAPAKGKSKKPADDEDDLDDLDEDDEDEDEDEEEDDEPPARKKKPVAASTKKPVKKTR